MAYSSGDASASRAAHSNAPIVVASEGHQEGGGRVKAIVFGGCVASPAAPLGARAPGWSGPARPSATTGNCRPPQKIVRNFGGLYICGHITVGHRI